MTDCASDAEMVAYTEKNMYLMPAFVHADPRLRQEIVDGIVHASDGKHVGVVCAATRQGQANKHLD